MSACLNCGAKITCGCQKRKASDGKEVCANCLSTYENKIKNPLKPATNNTQSNVNVFYKGPNK